MTAATVAQPNGNGFAVLLVMVLAVGLLIVGVLISHERRGSKQDKRGDEQDKKIDRLDRRLDALAEWNGVEINDPVEDDSPGHEERFDLDEVAEEFGVDLDDTDEFPAVPATEPSGIPVQVHGALIEARTHELMTPETAERQRVARAAFVEEQLARFDFSGRSK